MVDCGSGPAMLQRESAEGNLPGIIERAGKRDADASRRSLLMAARAQFAAKGLAGARVDEIARHAGINKQLVYHYFGSKDALYRAVLEDVYAEIRARERALSLEELRPEDAMVRLVEFSFDYLAAHPEFIALLNDENGNGGRHLTDPRRLHAMHSPLIALIRRTLRCGVAAGRFRHDVDALQLYISIAGLAYFYFSNNRTLSAIFGRDLALPRSIAARRRHVIAFVMAALRPGEPRQRRRGRASPRRRRLHG
jgi:TetR/AcrR family transcriptional regulator